MQADQRHLLAVPISANNHYVTSKTGDNEIHLSDHLVFD